MDCSPPGSSGHGILQAGILERVAMPCSRASSWPRDRTCVSYLSCLAGRFFTAEPPGEAHLHTYTHTIWHINKLHHCERLRPCPAYTPMACVIPTSWLNSHPLAPAAFQLWVLTAHCGASPKCQGIKGTRSILQSWLKRWWVPGSDRPPPRWGRLRARLNAAQWVDAPMVQSKDAQQDPLCWLPFIVSLPYYLSWNSLPNSTLTSAFGGRETMTAINIHSWIEEVRCYVLPGEHSFSKLF